MASTVVINAPPGFKERTRVLKSGKVKRKFTIEVESDPLIHTFDDRALGRGPAEAIVAVLKERLAASTKKISDATRLKRVYALDAFNRGARWAVKRYAGGRTGPTPPNPDSDQYGVDSGRLRDGFFTRHNPKDKSYTVNVPANRLKPEDFRPGAFETFLTELRNILDMESVTQSARYKNALEESLSVMIVRGKSATAAQRQQAIKALGGLGLALRNLATGLGAI